MKEQLCVVVENQPNVLPRVFRLLARHGLNIASLSVTATEEGDYLKIILTTQEDNLDQRFVKILRKLIDVVEVNLTCNQVLQKI